MVDQNEDTVEEFLESEQLQVFDVVETYCNACDSVTPHHIDDSKVHNGDDEIEPDATCLGAPSTHECVVCRENEENEIAGITT